MNDEQHKPQTAGAQARGRLSSSGDWSGDCRERLDAINATLADPQPRPFEVCRRIGGVMARVVQQIRSLSASAEDQAVLSGLVKRVKALRQLIKQVIDEQRLRKQDDVLNWEGGKFRSVFRNLNNLFGQAMIASGVDEFQRPMVWRNRRDLLTMNEERIRRAVAKLGR
jgi:malonyl CoA-acyl carrier protein transacylase